jgi:hypothetical protein
MATGALFIGWGAGVPGRERQALQIFNEGLQYYAELQQQGEIESFEPVLLEPHGGDLSGFILIKGDQEKLARLRTNEQFQRLNLRAGLVVHNFGVVGANIGEQQAWLFGLFEQQLADFQ